MTIPVKYRRGGGEPLGTYDFFSTLGGVGYATLYLAGGVIEADTKEYFLTMDSSIDSDTANFKTVGNSDLDFDLIVGKPFRVKAGTAVMNWTQHAAAGETTKTVWTIYHVDAASNETSIGTANGDQSSAVSYPKKCIQIAITAKAFKIGEKLRINAVTTANNNSGIWYDPAGRTIGTTTADSFLKLPVSLPT